MRGVAALWLAASLAAASPSTQDRLARAERLLEQRDYAGAEAVLREVLQADPSNARAHGNLALALLSQKKLREAVDEGRLAAAFGPQRAEARYIYGLTLRASARNIDSAREFERAAALTPGGIGPLEALADAYAASGDERAVPVYERLLALEPGNREHRLHFAEHLWTSGKPDRGCAIAAAALQEFPDFSELRARYGRALYDEQRFVDAADELVRARELGVRDAETLGLIANALWEAGRLEEAELAFETALREHPASAPFRLDRGRFLLARGEAESARRELEEAARLAPDDAPTSLQQGRAREAVGMLAGAEEAYRKAVALSPSLASPRYALGRLLVRQGRRDEGERELEVYRGLYARAARIQSETESRRGEILLAESELARGQPAVALTRLAGLPEGVDVLTARAKAYSRLNRHGEAVAALERARELQPEDVRIQAILAAERDRAKGAP